MLIQIETKAGMSEKALDILNGLKDIVIEKIEVKDVAYIQKKKELQDLYENAKKNPKSLKNHDEVWQEIESAFE